MLKVIMLIIVLQAVTVFAGAPEVKDTVKEVSKTLSESIDPACIQPEKGFCYTAALRLGRPGDQEGPLSPCVLTEDGKALGPAHAIHDDIRTQGRGRFSHWTVGQLYFSTGDNSDPRTSHCKYALVSDWCGLQHTTTVSLTDPTSTYEVRPSNAPVQNRRLILRNMDSRVAVMPLLNVKGRPDLTSMDGMLKSVLKTGMTDEQKAIAIWQFLVDWRYHHYPADETNEVHDPVKFINVYGYGFCDDCAQNFAALSEAAGMKGRVWGLNGHVVGEAFYGNRWHMFDPDHKIFFRAPDGNIMSVEELAENPSVITKTQLDPVQCLTTIYADIFTTTKDNCVLPPIPKPTHRLEPVLQPLDEATFDIGMSKLVRMVAYSQEPPPPIVGNGSLVRRLDFGKAEEELVITVKWPYVILGGELALTLTGDGKAEVAISPDGRQFEPLTVKATGGILTADLIPWVARQKNAFYVCFLKVRKSGGSPLKTIVREGRLTVIFQFSPRAMLQVQPGLTTFEATVTPVGGTWPQDWKGVEIVHEWDEQLSPTAPVK